MTIAIGWTCARITAVPHCRMTSVTSVRPSSRPCHPSVGKMSTGGTVAYMGARRTSGTGSEGADVAQAPSGVGWQRGPSPGRLPRRIATLSVHTSPLDQPGTGDAGGMNVYIVEVSRRLAEPGVEVEIFTRATSSGAAAGRRDGAGRAGPARELRPVRGPRQGRPAGADVRVRQRRAARRGGPRARLLRPDALALLALRPGRLAGPGALGRAAGAHRAHPRQGQERPARRR